MTKLDSKGGKDGDESKQSSTEVGEEKSVKNTNGAVEGRFVALVKADLNCYVNVMVGLVECRDSMLMILDNVEKNIDKLTSPKGSGGGYSYGGNSMY